MFNPYTGNAPDSQFTYTTPCERKDVCGIDGENINLIDYYIDESSLYYIKNWVE